MRTTIGRYRVTGLLGKGGMGVVYAAHDDRLDRAVAIKTLRAEATDASSRERLQREARAAARVNHPSIMMTKLNGTSDGAGTGVGSANFWACGPSSCTQW